MINRAKNDASERMNRVTASLLLDISVHSPDAAATSSSARSGCARSQSGRRPRTGGTSAKFSAGGGDVVAHSSVHASQGLSPAGAPAPRLILLFQRKMMTDASSVNAPIVEIMLSVIHHGQSG